MEIFLQYNNTVERGLFYQALNAVLEVQLDLAEYEGNLRRIDSYKKLHAARAKWTAANR